jgi:GrpB-like predicted nucleotidyltransferase (UPF0157 family)
MLDKFQKRPYSLEEPSDYWVNKFSEVRKIIESVFGDKALAIEHVGSTSLGIKAKPLLDVLIIVRNINDIFEEKEKMKEFGYLWEDEYIAPDTSFIYKLDGERKIENIHICEASHYKVDYFILKRDYFRAHPDKLKEYETLKVKLNEKFPEDYPAYRAGKEDFLENIYILAKEWRDKK